MSINNQIISVVTIGKLIEAFNDGNETKFISYANFIADKYKEAGDEKASEIIKSKLDGSYKNSPKIVGLDSNKR